MIDYFSKWAEAYALPNHKVKIVADSIINRWITHHGIPIRIHSDNPPEFRVHVITQLKKMLSMKGTLGQVTRSCNDGVSCYSPDITGFSPNMLVTGKETNMPLPQRVEYILKTMNVFVVM